MTRYRFAGFELGTAPARLERSGQPVGLRAQALKLLALFVRNSGETVTHAQIRSEIWGDRAIDHTKAIPLLVRDIRCALGESAKEPKLLETVPREGYRFVAQVEAVGEAPARIDRKLALAMTVLVAALGAAIFAVSNPSDPLPGNRPGTALVEKADHVLHSTQPDRLARARLYFEQAIDLDPASADARAGLAIVAAQQGNYPEAAELVRAIDRHPTAALAHAMISASRDNDWQAALDHTDRSLALDKANAEAWAMKAMLLTVLGQHDAALTASRQAYRIDPVSALIRIDHGWFHYYAGEFETALSLCKEGVELEPESWPPTYCWLKSAEALGDADETKAALQAIFRLWHRNAPDSQPPASIPALHQWHAAALAKGVADKQPWWEALAAVEMARGRQEEALALLEQAAANKSASLALSLRDPVFSPLSATTMFRTLECGTNMRSGCMSQPVADRDS